MYFNAFTLEKFGEGVMVKLGFVVSGVSADVLTVVVNREGLNQLSGAAREYVKTFGEVVPTSRTEITALRPTVPVFANFVRCASSKDTSEISFHVIPMVDLIPQAGPLQARQIEVTNVALLHSDMAIHRQLVLSLLAS